MLEGDPTRKKSAFLQALVSKEFTPGDRNIIRTGKDLPSVDNFIYRAIQRNFSHAKSCLFLCYTI